MREVLPLNKLPGLFIAVIFISVGSILIFGTRKRWIWLVDPPLDYWMVYSHSFIKKFLGRTFLIYFNYFLGILFIVLSLFGIWNEIRRAQ